MDGRVQTQNNVQYWLGFGGRRRQRGNEAAYLDWPRKKAVSPCVLRDWLERAAPPSRQQPPATREGRRGEPIKLRNRKRLLEASHPEVWHLPGRTRKCDATAATGK
ncbi:hypothetical protein H8959_001120 [Pygathrix nigripes]